VLGLQIAAPLHLIVKLVVVLLQQLYRLGIAHSAEVGIGHVLQPLQEALIHKGVKEGHLVRALLHHGPDDMLDHRLGHVHVPGQVAKGHLRLDHPEFRGVAGGIGLLGPEGGTEGIYVAEGHSKGLGVELAGHRQVGALPEEILAIVHRAVLCLGYAVHIQRGYPEHLARPLAVGGGDNGRMNIDKAPLLEEAVNGVGRHAAHPKGRGKQIGPGPQMGDGAQVFYRMALFLERIFRG